ncbi:hypothetical protein C1H46_040337 [Malus baccata]|uniref:Exostosin GT47 domain-containing protein n=1 Tax=Malus baccata TaxID=106549 RepID=A0A540KIR8_MALBA|nr:hypothetical protein C1H46_040337 [Malus baccata]
MAMTSAFRCRTLFWLIILFFLVFFVLTFSPLLRENNVIIPFVSSFNSTTTPFNLTKSNCTSLPQVSYFDELLTSSMYQRRHKANLTKGKTSLDTIEEGLAKARAAILEAIQFKKSHVEMMKRFKQWSYKEGEHPLIHFGPANDIYGIKGQFIDEIEREESPFRAKHPDEAHTFFLPFSVANVVRYVYMPITRKQDYHRDRLQRVVTDYISVVADKYPYWNRSNGNLDPPNLGQAPKSRPILAFFAGRVHRPVRPILLDHWKDKDDEVQVYEKLPKGLNYTKFMGQSKFCLCPSGFEVASPRIVEAIYAGCVPVLISDNYTLLFSDVLDWSKFSVQIPVDKIPEIKTILQAIPFDKYLKMQKRVYRVRRHFVLNRSSKPFDVIHMVLHSKMSNLERIEADLGRAREAIRKAVHEKNQTSNYKENDDVIIPKGSVYRNAQSFHQSYVEMEKRLKVWVYREGEHPLVHTGPLNDIYAIEGQFIDEMESGKSRFMARHPDEAHLFLIPISVANIVNTLYKPLVTYNRDQLQRVVMDYIGVIAEKYPHWNRSRGADHFLVSCHDWAPDISQVNPKLYRNFIRVLCNANISEGFKPQRDVSIPEINIPYGKFGPTPQNTSLDKRSILAFFAGGSHGHIRKILLEHWKDKDNEVQVHEYLKNKKDYFKLMGKAKFCLCPSGYEVASARVVTAISVGCVPVLISDDYVLPFSDVLDWSQFSVYIPSKKIPEIKTILRGISPSRYLELQKSVMEVHRHFTIHRPAQPYDMLHMVLHSVWLRRLDVSLLS